MKLKFVLLALVGAAGAMASYALADSGHRGHEHANALNGQTCSRAVVFGTTAAPQSFTVTVTHAGRKSPFHTGDVVTVSLGAQGQDVAISGFGCANGSALDASMAMLRVRVPSDHSTTTTTAAATTSTDTKHGGDHHHRTTTTTTTTTADTTTTSDTTTAQTTTNGL